MNTTPAPISVVEAANAKSRPAITFIIRTPPCPTEEFEVCLESVLSQTISNIEIILAGGGVDASQYKSADSRIQLGQEAEFATGEYVVFLEPNDLLAPEYGAVMLSAAWNSQADVVRGRDLFRREFIEQHIRLDLCTMCNLECTGCFMRRKNYCNRGKGFVPFAQFSKFLNDNKFVRHIEISGQGEPFLNPHIVKILEYAHAHNVRITCENGTNFNAMPDEVLDAIVSTGVGYINVAIDGASQDTYVQYRRGGDFDRVIANIKKLNEYKRAANSELPKLGWQYVILPTNDSVKEIQRAKAMAVDLNMKISFLRDNNGYVPPNREEIERETGLSYGDGVLVGQASFARNTRDYVCTQLWNAPQINWDGRLLGCCMNMFHDYDANVFAAGLEKALQTPLYTATKEMLCGGKTAKGSPCLQCHNYKEMQMRGQWLCPATRPPPTLRRA
ncbi:MAG: radical SAM protein [Rickettsiales bacterium]|jgi:organic radical activating enzyme|nr:radical SAM protein [Rickettsiales bacterium]